MYFTNSEIRELLDILKAQELVFIATQLGVEFLTDFDKELLRQAGVDLDQFTNSKGVIEHAFLFGMLADAVGSKRAKGMNYKQFRAFVASKNFIPLTDEEELALQTIKTRAYNDITALGSRMRTGVGNILLKQNQATAAQKMIRDKAARAIELRQSAPKLAQEFADASKNWDADWLRVAYYLTHEAYNSGRAQSILRQYGKDAKVYFDVYEGACKHCRTLGLVYPDDPMSEPIIYKLDDIIANGNNIGRKASEWRSTISPIHPYCRCTLMHKPDGFEWDEELRAFTKPKKREVSNPKLRGVKLNIKVTK